MNAERLRDKEYCAIASMALTIAARRLGLPNINNDAQFRALLTEAYVDYYRSNLEEKKQATTKLEETIITVHQFFHGYDVVETEEYQ